MLNGNFCLSFGLFLNEIFVLLIYLLIVCIFFFNWFLYIFDVFIVIVYCSIYYFDFILFVLNKKCIFGLKNINWGFLFDKKKM